MGKGVCLKNVLTYSFLMMVITKCSFMGFLCISASVHVVKCQVSKSLDLLQRGNDLIDADGSFNNPL